MHKLEAFEHQCIHVKVARICSLTVDHYVISIHLVHRIVPYENKIQVGILHFATRLSCLLRKAGKTFTKTNNNPTNMIYYIFDNTFKHMHSVEKTFHAGRFLGQQNKVSDHKLTIINTVHYSFCMQFQLSDHIVFSNIARYKEGQ